MPTGTIMPSPVFLGLSNTGAPLSGGKLYTYAAGSSTPLPTYSDAGLTTPNANPVVLDSAGRATVFLTAAGYKFVLKTSADVTVYTADNIASIAVGQSGGLGEIFTFGGDASSPVVLTAYPAGATVDKLHAGSAIYSVDSANLPGTYALTAMLLGNGGTITLALVNLTDGSTETPIVTVASADALGARVVSSAITFPAAGTVKTYGIKALVSAGSGLAWAARLERIA